MTSLMGAKTRAEPEVIYYLLQVQERAFGEGCIDLRYSVYTYVYSATCTVRPVVKRRGGAGGAGAWVSVCLSVSLSWW